MLIRIPIHPVHLEKTLSDSLAVSDTETVGKIRELLHQGCVENAMDRLPEIDCPILRREMREVIREYDQ